MMHHFASSYNVVIVFIITLFMNWAVETIKSDSGYIRKGQIFYIGDDRFMPIDIENKTSGLINGIKVLVPIGLEPGEIFSSRPVLIEKVEVSSSSDQFNLFKISRLNERSVTRIILPIKNHESICCEFLNKEELGLKVKTDDSVANPLMTSFWKGVQTATIYGILIYFAIFWLKSKIKNLHKENKEISEDFSRKFNEVEEKERFARESLAEVRQLYKRQRAFLLRRTSDFEKEVSFWRDTIRKMVLSKGADKNDVNKMLREISKSIKTLTTHGNVKEEYENFEALQEAINSIDESLEK